MKKLLFICSFFCLLGMTQVSAQTTACPPFSSLFTQKFACQGPNCTDCPWYFSSGAPVTIVVNGVVHNLVAWESFAFNAGDVVVVFLPGGGQCTYSNDEWC